MCDDQIVPPIRREFRVGKYTVLMEFSFESRTLTSEWWPHAPDPETLTADECTQYRAGRDAVLGAVSERTGLRIAVVEGGAEHAKQIQAGLEPGQSAVHTWKGKSK